MKKQIHEIYWIRALACLSVVFIHVLTRTYSNHDLPESTINNMKTIQVFFMFATPMFVMISEVVMANAYSKSLPKSFFKKRFLYLFLPFLTVPFIYGFFYKVSKNLTWNEFAYSLVENILLASWHGYFILIILQFVVIHAIFVKWLHKVKAWKVLLTTFAINSLYLYLVNFHLELLPQAMQNWFPFVRVPFLGWIFYFTVAYYVGKNLEKIKAHRLWGFPLSVGAAMTSGYVLWNIYKSGVFIEVSSVRLDIILYTVSLFFVLLYLFSFVKGVPNAIMFVSNYSFPIYLLHFMAFNLGDLILPKMSAIAYGLCMFLFAIFASVLMARVMNLLPLGKFVVGPLKGPTRGTGILSPNWRTQ